MAKNTSKTVYICGECGYESAKWLGNCPACSAWNTMVAFAPGKSKDAASFGTQIMAAPLSEIKTDQVVRIHTGIGELDRVLGGGVVPGSVILLVGDPMNPS